jgi:protein TonB
MNKHFLLVISALLISCSGSIKKEPLKILSRIPPVYPFKNICIRGHVKLQFLVQKDGTVSSVRVIESEPEGIFDLETINAVEKWRFKPEIINGEVVEQQTEQLFYFRCHPSEDW